MKATDGFISRYLNRRISARITHYILKKWPDVTPNTVTWFVFSISLLSPLFFILGSSFLGGLWAQIGSIVDGVDGEIARAKGMCSAKGAFLDTVLDRIVNFLIIVSASYFSFSFEGHPLNSVFWVSTLSIFGDMMVSYLHAVGREIFGVHPASYGMVPSFATRDVRLFIIFVFSVLGLVFEALILITLVSYLYVIAKCAELLWKEYS